MKIDLKYPVLLVHGMGFRDDLPFAYWGRIPKVLEDAGVQVFFGNQDGLGNIEENAEIVKKAILETLDITGAEKVNIIAHSKGGLDSRYAIANLGMAEKVASLTTIATPHNGSKTVDFLLKLPDFIVRIVAVIGNLWYKRFGDKKPDCYRVFHSFKTENAVRFNQNTKDCEAVYYQSYASVMKNCTSDVFLWLPNLLVKWIEGENDGLLTPESVKWGEYKGVIRSEGRRGISHLDQIDLRRRPLVFVSGEKKTDIPGFYTGLVRQLSDMGY